MLAAPYLIVAIAPGFPGAKRELTIRLVRILFPGAGLLVLSAWCLGILNSHRKFFLSYTAPGDLEPRHDRHPDRVPRPRAQIPLAVDAGVGLGGGQRAAVAGAVPGGAAPGPPPATRSWRCASPHVREVMRNFVPVFFSRGVVQISAYVDAPRQPAWATARWRARPTRRRSIHLPVSLFGMAVSAAELPAMSSALGTDAGGGGYLRARLDAGLRRIAFFIVPSAMAFLALGDVIAAALFQTGQFSHADSLYVWGILAGSAVGLLASTLGRLYSSTYYALRDTRTPLRFAVVRVALTIGARLRCVRCRPARRAGASPA